MPKIKTSNNFGLAEDRIGHIKKYNEEQMRKYNNDFLRSVAEIEEYESILLKKEAERRRNTSIFERWGTISKDPSKWW